MNHTAPFPLLRWLPALILLWGLSPAYAQPALPGDELAARWLTQGQTALQSGYLEEARFTFLQVISRPVSVQSAAGWYLLGHTYWRMGLTDSAGNCWNNLLMAFPESMYAPEARYHINVALTLHPDPYYRQQGLLDLAQMAFYFPDTELAADAFRIFQEALFAENDMALLQRYDQAFPELFRPAVLEAMVYLLVRQGETAQAKALYERRLQSGFPASAFIEQWLAGQSVPVAARPDAAKIAVFLPLFLADDAQVSGEVPRQSRLGLDYYEGFRLGLEAMEQTAGKKYLVRVFDTRKDSLFTQNLLAQLDDFAPDVVVGDVYNGPMAPLSDWAEYRSTPVFAPISPAGELIQGRQNVFLAHPSVETHSARLAEYAWHTLGLKKITVWTNKTSGTHALATQFVTTFNGLGGQTQLLSIDSSYTTAMRQISSQAGKVRTFASDGVYIPILNNEESAGLILSLIQAQNQHLTILGGPHWYTRYHVIDRHLKERSELIFTTSFFRDPESAAYLDFVEAYQSAFAAAPSDYALYGFDLAQTLVLALDRYDPVRDGTFQQYLHTLPEIAGIHGNTVFGLFQSNQFVNICQFTPDGIKLLNRVEPVAAEPFTQPEDPQRPRGGYGQGTGWETRGTRP